jgi:hypothetical protein
MLPKMPIKYGVMLFCFGTLICHSTVSLAQDDAKPFVRLATYWDAPGVVKSISTDDRWLVIYDSNTQTSRLVEVATGQVLITNAVDNSIRYSPLGRFASVNTGEKQTAQIFDLSAKKEVVEAPGVVVKFSPDESLVMVSKYDSAAQESNTTVADTKSGTVRLRVEGDGNAFSPDSRVIGIDDSKHLTTRLVEVSTGKPIFEFPTRDYQEGAIPNTNVRFSPDGKLVAIHQLSNITTYVIDTGTWVVLYDIYGFVTFSPDSHYLKVRQSDGGEAPNVLLEASTGKQLDKVYGELWFSDDSKLLYRSDSTNCAYQCYMQVIDLSSMKPLIDIQKCVGLEAVEDGKIIEVYDEDITAPQVHQFIDLATGSILWQAKANDVDMIDYDRRLVLMSDHGRQSIENFETGEVLVAERQITLSNSKQLAFASNGTVVDLYGSPDMRVDTMPAPGSDK